MPSLADRLNALGLKKGNEILKTEPKLHPSLDEVVKGVSIENQLGSVVVVEKIFPYGYRHGDIEISKNVELEQIHSTGGLNGQINNLTQLVFLDTETTGLSGGTGTIAFLVGLARFDQEGLKLTQFIIKDPTDEPAMLLALSNYAADAQGMVTFNGKTFDLPLLKTRYTLNRMPFQMVNWGHLDLLFLSRKIWKQRLPSRSLKDLETEILHIPRTEDEVPGWMIPEIYFNYLRTGDASQIANVVYHNAMDIVSLAALYITITKLLEEDLFSYKIPDLDIFSIGQIYENIGEKHKAMEIYEHCLARNKLPQLKKRELAFRLSILYKKQQIFDKAVVLWSKNGNDGDFESCVELAKYFEHEEKDALTALKWTNQAVLYLESADLPRYKIKMIQKELLVRKNRLEKRTK